MKKIYQNKSGFTMVEILVAVIIIISLVTMAVPLYDRAIEKSRIGQARIMLKRIGEAKVRAMNNRDITNYEQGAFSISELDVTVPSDGDWNYGLFPGATFANGVCAVRASGKNQNKITLLYLGEVGEDICTCAAEAYSAGSVCEAYCEEGEKLFCHESGSARCETYSMDHFSNSASSCQ